jgi:glycosyltransferase involved in cell wall biosynthesis
VLENRAHPLQKERVDALRPSKLSRDAAHWVHSMADRSTPDLISVIVPVLDDAEHLPHQLEALAGQDYGRRWEAVIADNGSTDGSVELARRWLGELPGGRLVLAEGSRSASRARNAGAAQARGDFLAFCDADDVVSSDWLTELAAAAREGDVVAGAVDAGALCTPLVRSWHTTAPRERAIAGFRFLVHASGTNTGVWADVLRQLGGFDERFRVGEDIEFSWRAQLAGYRLVVAERALVHERLRGDVGSLARQHYSYGQAGPRLYRRFRRAGMPRAALGEAVRTCAWLACAWPLLPWSPRLRGRWALEAALQAGRAVGSARDRVLFI